MKIFRALTQLALFTFGALLLQSVSCKPGTTDDNPPVHTPGKYSVTVDINNVFGTEPLKFQTPFITAAQDTITIKPQFAYYLSNFKFTKSDGSVYAAPESYFLVHYESSSDDPSKASIKIDNIPEGTYTKVSFLMGVDSARNHSGAQTGALDPGYNMIWTWNTGYIFHRIKGNTGSANATITLDIGGDANIMAYDLPVALNLASNRKMNMKMDLKELFQNPYVYDLKMDDKDIHSTTTAGLIKLVANSKDMFSISSVE